MLSLIPLPLGSEIIGLSPSPMTKTFDRRVANSWPAASRTCTMSNEPLCFSRWTTVPMRPWFLPPTTIASWPTSNLSTLVTFEVGELEDDGVVDLDVGVGVAQRPAVVRRDVGDAAGADLQLLDAEQLVAGLLGADAVANEAALGVVDQAEALVGAVERDDVHQPRGVGGVGADLPVDLDEALHEDGDDLLAGEGVPAWWVVVKRGGGVGGEREREESGERESKGTGKR